MSCSIVASKLNVISLKRRKPTKDETVEQKQNPTRPPPLSRCRPGDETREACACCGAAPQDHQKSRAQRAWKLRSCVSVRLERHAHVDDGQHHEDERLQ
ncbi:MAG: hypothetical protein KDK91_01155, partial [Gammaproteobacteria bacterium]|nr:hypothetical protein [Gammaproteobacteria bacterium]